MLRVEAAHPAHKSRREHIATLRLIDKAHDGVSVSGCVMGQLARRVRRWGRAVGGDECTRTDGPRALLVASSRIEDELLVGLAALQKPMRLGGLLQGKLTLAAKV